MNRFLIVLILAGIAQAHSGSRLYPFYELTDEMLEEIDIHDGLIDEWYEIGEPSMTLLDFQTYNDPLPGTDQGVFEVGFFLPALARSRNAHDLSGSVYCNRTVRLEASLIFYPDPMAA